MKTNINYIRALNLSSNRYKIKRELTSSLEKLSNIDKKLSVLDHIIENEDMNSINTVTIFKKVKALRIERRTLKNDIIILKELKIKFFKYNLKIKGFKDPLFSKEKFNKVYNSKFKELNYIERKGKEKYNKNILDLI